MEVAVAREVENEQSIENHADLQAPPPQPMHPPHYLIPHHSSPMCRDAVRVEAVRVKRQISNPQPVW